MSNSGATDVQYQILSSRYIECPYCWISDKLLAFGRWVQDRAGLKIVHCECERCHGTWRRIDCED